MKRDYQIDQIEKRLLRGLSITPLQALKLYGCMRLGAVIHVLKKTCWGEGIKSKLVKVSTKHGRGYAYVSKYWLEE